MQRVIEVTPLHPSAWSAIEAVAAEFEIGSPETLRRWVRQADVTAAHPVDPVQGGADELTRLRREVGELQRSNAILKATSTFFAAELDRPCPRS